MALDLAHASRRTEPTLERFIVHIEHAAAVMGTEHLAIGGDYLRQILRAMGLQDQLLEGLPADAAIERLEGPRDLPALADALRARGWPEPTIAALFGDNLLRLLRRALAA